MELRVWWVTNAPSQPKYYPVSSVDEAIAKLKELEERDLADADVNDNAGGLEVFEDGEWTEYSDDEGNVIDDIMRQRGLRY